MKISIFTATYNRAELLKRLYASIKQQNYDDFEWIIIDDGSNDNTETYVRKWIDSSNFSIIYKKVINGGKHRAINLGLKLSSGELFFIVDSDDCLVSNVLVEIDNLGQKLINNSRFIGFSGRCLVNDKYLGDFPCSSYLDCTSLQREKKGITGDQAEVFFTEKLKKYPFPEYENEKFLSEAVVWNKISGDGLILRWFNIPFLKKEYQTGGLSDKLYYHLSNSPKGFVDYVNSNLIYQNSSLKHKLTWYYIFSHIMRVYKNYSIKECSKALNVNFSLIAISLILGTIKEKLNEKKKIN